MKKTSVIAKAVVKNQDGDILLIRRGKTAPRRALEWDLPGGFVEEGEDFATAVMRETDEEVGIVIAREEFQLAYTHTANLDFGNVCWLFFLAKTKQTNVKLSFEHDKYQWTTINRAIEIMEYKLQKDLLTYLDVHKLLV